MAIKMIRKESDTQTVSNIDDIIAMRYAYGNQNGYIKGKGTELSYTVNGLDFTINSGRFVVQGVEVDIDANGTTLTVDNVSSLRYFIVYAKVDLGLNDVQILTTYNSLGYPNIPESQDLTVNSNGIAYIEIYRFKSSGASITNINKTIKEIEYYYETTNGNKFAINSKGALTLNNIYIIPIKKVLMSQQVDITSAHNGNNATQIYSGDVSGKELQIKFKHMLSYEGATGFWEYTVRVKFSSARANMVVYSYGGLIIQVGPLDNANLSGLFAEATGSTNATYVTEISEIIE